MVGITGSNGKSTTTLMTGELLKAAGMPVEVCGNIGVPLSSRVDGAPGRTYWNKAIAESASAMDSVTAPDIVTGAIAPARVKGVTITGWPRRARRMAPSSIR